MHDEWSILSHLDGKSLRFTLSHLDGKSLRFTHSPAPHRGRGVCVNGWSRHAFSIHTPRGRSFTPRGSVCVNGEYWNAFRDAFRPAPNEWNTPKISIRVWSRPAQKFSCASSHSHSFLIWSIHLLPPASFMMERVSCSSLSGWRDE
jgi:hypothetical protein